MPPSLARRYFIRGSVQGVGFRYFVQKIANQMNLAGYARNLDDGRVEVYAIGTRNQLADLAAALWRGPSWSEVRGVDEKEAPLEHCTSFEIRH
ncbi:MAG TPA: acylphosphatase [Bryobacteraceae bacterium]|nr:acylphosphatase [Bryobacteraceae bacterium]